MFGIGRMALVAGLLMLAGGVPAQAQLIVAVNAGESSRIWRKIVVPAFKAQTGIEATIFESPLPSSSIAQANGQPDFDAAMIATYSLARLAQRNLLDELTPEDIPAIRKVPEKFWPRTPGGKLAGVPLYFSIYGIAYNTDMAKASDFQSWNDLLAPKWRGQISMTRPVFLAPYDATLFAKLNGGSDDNPRPGYDFIAKLAANSLNVYSSMASLEAQLARGEVVAAPFYSAEVMSVKRGGSTDIGFVVPREGGLVLSYFVGIPKGAPHRAAALQLLNAILDQAYQEGFAQEAGWWPMNPAVTLPPALVQEMGGTQSEMMARNYYPDWNVVGMALEQRIREVEDLIRKGN
jgi:putative spermidine/putrescine transport system substrate-binding protein